MFFLFFFSYLEIFFIFKMKINIEFLLFGCESKINFLLLFVRIIFDKENKKKIYS